MIRIWGISGQELLAVPVESQGTAETVAELKTRLRASHSLPVCQQKLLHDGICLDDNFKLETSIDLQLVLVARFCNTAQKREAARELTRFVARGARADVVRKLLEAGTDPNAEHEDGLPALFHASSKGI